MSNFVQERIHFNNPTGFLKSWVASNPKYNVFLTYVCIPMIKFNLQMRHSKKLTMLINNQIEKL